MNEIGVANALKLVEAYANDNPGFPVPRCIAQQAASGKSFEIGMVFRRDYTGVAVIKIRRPAVLNALNLEVFRQLRNHCEAVERDPHILGAVITGFGTKAFVSGADIDMLAALKNAAEGEANSRKFHDTLDYIEDMKKPVVCAYNGLALGGGNELAMACHASLLRRLLRAFLRLLCDVHIAGAAEILIAEDGDHHDHHDADYPTHEYPLPLLLKEHVS
jgi:enoyl-CoA hydratase/3-hydroxyacyl-CoA dehydrogenase